MISEGAARRHTEGGSGQPHPERNHGRREHVQAIPELRLPRLGLEDWTELPARDSRDWETLQQLLVAHFDPAGRVGEVQHNGADLFLQLTLDSPAMDLRALIESVRREWQSPFWRPFLDLQRYAWVGDYHLLSLRPDDKLDAYPLEHPARRWKREHLERLIGRTLETPWHEAPTPEAMGIEFVGCVAAVSEPEASFTLFYRAPGESQEAFAAHLNTRLRLPGTAPRRESVGWSYGPKLTSLVFTCRLYPHLRTAVHRRGLVGDG